MKRRSVTVAILAAWFLLISPSSAPAASPKPPAAKVSWDRASKKIEIENYSALPVDLLKVTSKKH